MSTPIYCIRRKDRHTNRQTTGSWELSVTAPSIAPLECDTLITPRLPTPEPAAAPRRPVIGLTSSEEGQRLAEQVRDEHLRLMSEGMGDPTMYVWETDDFK